MGRRVIGISEYLIWSKTLVELMFNPCSEFRRSPEGPVGQIHSLHLQVCVPGIFSDFFKVYSDAKGTVTGNYRTYSSPGKAVALVPEFAVENLPLGRTAA